ncbi:1-deoxypentalenic acid 11-beta-hydroxylase [Pseudocercospora fuligena]|uniref:1-deoxypentalenic acid 11-beta-hydroxylase n=1 Tax=Pseudocercospora fuligena TaxID=685502 RepID=A0A8H6VFX1_9PEZI|nr:1-deoxypentalenic acid 11-beta-hydroxylase [Pseudocercospora fuligena]
MATTQAAPVPAHELIYEPNHLPKLRSNYGDYLDKDTVGWMRETPIDTPLPEMRKRFDEDGYIFVKNVMPREDVLDMREAYFTHMSSTGILKPGTSPRDGIFDSTQDPVAHHGNGGRDLPGEQEKVDKLITAHTHPIYLAFLNHPKLRTFIREFMNWEKEVIIKRTLLRHNVPQGFSTGIHYDKIFLRAGTADFLTAWVPIGDCTASGGGLMYLENSTDIGLAMESSFNKSAREKGLSDEEIINGFNVNMAKDGQLSHDVSELTREIEEGVHGGERKKRRWLVADYEAGDVVFHNPYMIHGAIKNDDDRNRIRLSTDLRFYEEGSDLDERWMRSVWTPGDGL